MRIDWTISALGHAGVLAVALVTFSAAPLPKTPDSLAVDVISAKDFSEVMAGNKTAPKAKTPKPLVEKIAERKPVEEPKAKITKQKEIHAARAEKPPPEPERRPKPVKLAKAEPTPKLDIKPETKPTPKPEPKKAAAKPEPKKAAAKPEPKKKAEPKVDPIAEALKKEAAKEQREARERERKEHEHRPKKHEEPRFDPSKIAALLDKREPLRQEATGSALSSTPSLGLPTAHAAHLSQSEIDALKARLMHLWNPPVGASNPDELVVRVRVQLSPDGRIVGAPEVLSTGRSMPYMISRESAMRALFQGQPFDMLRREHYDQWKDIEITFDPRDMMHG